MTKLIRLLLLVAAFVVIGNTYAQTCPTGMISYWKMDDGESTTCIDSKGGINGTYSSILLDQPGVMTNTKAKDFDGGSNVDIPNNAAYAFGATSSFTIEMWIKIGSSSSGSQILLGKGDGSSNGIWYVGIEDGVPFAYAKDANGNTGYITASSAIGANIWHHIVVVRNETGDLLSIYLDGVVQPDQKTINFTGSFANSDIMTMGYLISGGSANYFFDGHLDEVAVYNRALTGSEISSHYTNCYVKGVGYCDPLYPVFTSTPVNKAVVNSPYTYALKATGAKPMTYSWITKPTTMTMDGSGNISWTPTTTNIDALVSVKADNGYAPADTQSFRIYLAEATVCTDNAMLLLKLNETGGATYDDAIAGGHDGSVVSTTAPTPTASKTNYGGAQLFDATSGIDLPDNRTEFEWSNSDNFSIEFWMKTSQSTSAGVCVSRHRTDFNERVASWWVGVDGGFATFDLQDNDTADGINWYTPSVVGSKNIADNSWHHILAVRNGSTDDVILYVDGVQDGIANVNYKNSFKTDEAVPVTLGYMLRTGAKNPYHFLGALDEVAIYNRAISALDAAAFYALAKGHCPEGNYAPVITSTPVTTATEDVTYTYTFTVEDVDDATVTLSAVTKPAWLTFNYIAGQKTATLTGMPGDANIGTAGNNVTLRVTDSKSTKDQSFVVTVANVNDLPVKTTTPTTTVNEDVAYSYTLTFTDADLVDDTYSIIAVTLPTWLTLNYTNGNKTATISGTPVDANTGANPIDLTYSDGHVTYHESYTLTVNAINDLPVITGQVALVTDEDEAIVISKDDITFVDPDNAAADITLAIQPGSDYTFSGTTVTPEADFNGSLAVNVVANDLVGSSAPYILNITVIAVNDAPVITSTPVLNVDKDNLYIYLFTATDVDNASLTKSVVSKPDWLTFSASTGVLTGTPHNSDGRQHLVILRVSDGPIDIDQTFTITVAGITAISEVQNNEFSIYPVPVSDIMNVKFNALQEETTVDIISASGSIVKSVIVPANTEIANISVEGFESGIYFCHFKNNTLNCISRIIVK